MRSKKKADKFSSVVTAANHLRFWFVFGVFCLWPVLTNAQSTLLDRSVTIEAQSKPLGSVLSELEAIGGFNFSYNSDHISRDSVVSVSANGVRLQKVLNDLLGKDVKATESGHHIILVRQSAKPRQRKKREYTITGHIRDGSTGQVISRASVYHVNGGMSVLTDQRGYFELTVASRENEFLGINFSRSDFVDTLIVVWPSNHAVDINLTPRVKPMNPLETPKVGPIPSPTLDTFGLVRFVVNEDLLAQANNLSDVQEFKMAQVSLVPMLGTNRRLSGLTTNNLSLNVIAGYSQGVDGLEIGGFANINRGDMNGVQVAGFGNVLGGEVRGLQIGGFFNHNVGDMNGVQVAGFSNVVMNALDGVQIAGFSNVARKEMSGFQVSGFNNLCLEDVDGFQVAGFSNVAKGDVNLLQVSGFANYAKDVNAAQVSGFINLAKGKVRGLQLSGFANYAEGVGTAQVAGGVNICDGDVQGVQVASLLNKAHTMTGVQIGIVNLSDSLAGIPIGLFNYVRAGLHKLELSSSLLFPASLDFRTGVLKFHNLFSAGYAKRERGQVWVAGYGMGTEHGKGKLRGGVDAMAYQQFYANTANFKTLDLLTSLRFNVTYPLGKHLRLVGGPVANLHITDRLDAETGEPTHPVAPYVSFDGRSGNTRVLGWFGGRIGVRF